MRSFGLALTLLALLLGSRYSAARCLDDPGDGPAIVAARAALAAACDCEQATSHRGYLKCVSRAVNHVVTTGALRPACRRQVMRCAAKSTCGLPGRVTCCFVDERVREAMPPAAERGALRAERWYRRQLRELL